MQIDKAEEIRKKNADEDSTYGVYYLSNFGQTYHMRATKIIHQNVN